LCLQLIREKLILSAHDCSDGGLAVATVESCIAGPEKALGATLNHTPIQTCTHNFETKKTLV